jgi:hypothetical protein
MGGGEGKEITHTTSKEEKNITRERKRRRENKGIRVDFSLPQRFVQSHLPHPLSPSKVMNEKEFVGFAFFLFFFFFLVAKFHHLMTKKTKEKKKFGEKDTHTHTLRMMRLLQKVFLLLALLPTKARILCF